MPLSNAQQRNAISETCNKGNNSGTVPVARPELPPLAPRRAALPARARLLLQLQPVAPHAAGVVVEGNVAVVLGHKAVRDQVASDPAFDAAAGGVDGGVLETARAVAGPVMRRLWELGAGGRLLLGVRFGGGDVSQAIPGGWW